MYCVVIFIHLKVFSNFPCDFFFDPLTKIVLFNFHIIVNFLVFIYKKIIFSFIILWLEKTLCMIQIFLNLSRIVLWYNIWFSLENVPHAREINVYVFVQWSVPYTVDLYYYRFHIFQLSYSLKFMYNPEINTHGAFSVICGHTHAERGVRYIAWGAHSPLRLNTIMLRLFVLALIL